MTLDVLITQLLILKEAGFSGDTRILMSSDAEGNQIHDLDAHGFEWARAEDDGWRLLDPEDMDEYEDDEIEEVVVLWP